MDPADADSSESGIMSVSRSPGYLGRLDKDMDPANLARVYFYIWFCAGNLFRTRNNFTLR